MPPLPNSMLRLRYRLPVLPNATTSPHNIKNEGRGIGSQRFCD